MFTTSRAEGYGGFRGNVAWCTWGRRSHRLPTRGGGHLTVLKNKNQEKGEKSEGKMHTMVWRLHLRYAHGILYVDYTALKVDS